MFDLDNWKEIFATLSRNKTRTFLTAFGIFWGTLMLALLLGASEGFKQMIFSTIDGLASNSAAMFPQRTTMPYKGYKKGSSWSLNQKDVDNIRLAIPEIESLCPMSSRNASAKHNDKTYATTSLLVEPNYAEFINPIIVSGRFINDSDLAKRSKVCVIGTNTANTLFAGDDPLGQFIEIDNIHYTVVGVAKQRAENINVGARIDDAVIMPLTTGRIAYNLGDRLDFCAIIVKDKVSPTALRPRIFHALRMEHPLHPDDTNAMFFMDISKEFEEGMTLLAGIEILILFVGLSSLIAGIIGVGNIMWVIVKERTKEFGIRRAIGAKPRTVMMQIMQEGALLTAIAGTSGIVAAVGILQLATNIIGAMPDSPPGLSFQLTLSQALWIMATFLVLGSAAGAIPAVKAMRIKPIEALNDK